MANRTMSLMKQLLQFGVDRGILTVNVCADMKKKSVGGVEKGRDRTLSFKEIKDFWLKVEKFPTYKSVPIALKILLVTAQRRGTTTERILLRQEWCLAIYTPCLKNRCSSSAASPAPCP